jgi:DNA-binding CsgD family transcriptional regulator
MVFQLTVKGHTTREIERILHVSHGTVCGDMKEIRQRSKQVVANYFNETLPTIKIITRNTA